MLSWWIRMWSNILHNFGNLRGQCLHCNIWFILLVSRLYLWMIWYSPLSIISPFWKRFLFFWMHKDLRSKPFFWEDVSILWAYFEIAFSCLKLCFGDYITTETGATISVGWRMVSSNIFNSNYALKCSLGIGLLIWLMILVISPKIGSAIL